MANKYPTTRTPRGVLVYPHITEPDTKFVKPDGEYHTKFALEADSDEANAFVGVLQEVMDTYIAENPDELKPAVIKKAARAAFYEEELDEEGEETGRWIFKFKLKARIKTKTKEWDQSPALFDSNAQPVPEPLPIVWTGTEAKAILELFPYFMNTSKTFGISMRCNAFQILKLVEGQGKSGASYGFEVEEDGYTTVTDEFEPEDGAVKDAGGDDEF